VPYHTSVKDNLNPGKREKGEGRRIRKEMIEIYSRHKIYDLINCFPCSGTLAAHCTFLSKKISSREQCILGVF
jgi:hypothetical protein